MMLSKSASGTAAAVLLLGALEGVSAYWRMSCFGIAGIAQLDPLVSPGEVSSHVHTIKGAGGFSATSGVDDLLASNCTSCEIAQDKSSYWTPTMYFMDTNGTTTIVPEISHLTYYKYVPAFVNGVHTFPTDTPNGLSMISGNSFRRDFTLAVPDPPLPWSGGDATQDALAQKAVGFNCLGGAVVEGSLYRHFLPTKSWLEANCPAGLRLELLFPICWNGADLDPPDHKSHVAYSDAGLNGGNCPAGFDTVINQLFYETTFDTNHFKGQDGIFALANGDPTGYGYHGDVIVAWEVGVLEQANTQCGPDALSHVGVDSQCPVFDIKTREQQESCKIQPLPALRDKNVQTGLSGLPGKNPLQYGPQPATPAGEEPAPPPTPAVVAGPTGSVGIVFHEASVISTSTTTSPPAPPTAPVLPPAVTPAPPAGNPPEDTDLLTISTMTYTQGLQQIEVVIVEEVVTVTLAAAPAKREAHHHHAAHHRRHGRRA